jgi:hypothetical protein
MQAQVPVNMAAALRLSHDTVYLLSSVLAASCSCRYSYLVLLGSFSCSSFRFKPVAPPSCLHHLRQDRSLFLAWTWSASSSYVAPPLCRARCKLGSWLKVSGSISTAWRTFRSAVVIGGTSVPCRAVVLGGQEEGLQQWFWPRPRACPSQQEERISDMNATEEHPLFVYLTPKTREVGRG